MKIAIATSELVVGDTVYLDGEPRKVLAIDTESGSIHPEGKIIRIVLPSGVVIARGWWENLFVERQTYNV